MIAAGSGPRVLSVWSGMTSRSKECALDVLESEEWSELYLRLPRDWKDAIMAIGEGFDFESVVEEMRELDQVRIPEDAQLIRSWRPFLEHMWAMLDEREIHCLVDPITFGQHRQISLDLATASVKARLGFIRLQEWRDLLTEDVDLSLRDGEREARIICLSAGEGAACVDLSSESERRLVEEGFQVRRVILGEIELPLAALKGDIMRAREVGEEVSDQRIERGIKDHLWFLELLLSSDSFEEAC